MSQNKKERLSQAALSGVLLKFMQTLLLQL